MTRQTLKHFAVSSALLGVLLSAPLSGAQVGARSKLPGKRAASSSAQMASGQAKTPGSPSYTFTLLSYPGTLTTAAEGINLGASSSKMEVVGGYGANPTGSVLTQYGFLTRVSGKKTVVESYQSVKYPPGMAQQAATGINDSGQIVGIYSDSSGNHSYELTGGKFTQIEVPFAGGAALTFAWGINNSGEVVGTYASDGSFECFSLVGTTYTSFNYPGGTYCVAFGINSKGDIVGQYDDAEGVGHGFLLSGGTYTSFDPPGAIETFGFGINDSGDIVGSYCTTSECISTGEGEQGYLLSGGVFTTIAVPGEFYTDVQGINNNGVIVGLYQDAAGLEVSFLATP